MFLWRVQFSDSRIEVNNFIEHAWPKGSWLRLFGRQFSLGSRNALHRNQLKSHWENRHVTCLSHVFNLSRMKQNSFASEMVLCLQVYSICDSNMFFFGWGQLFGIFTGSPCLDPLPRWFLPPMHPTHRMRWSLPKVERIQRQMKIRAHWCSLQLPSILWRNLIPGNFFKDI